eukprot:1137676-Pelagomonas_calceolata.AAC.2
MATPGRTCLCCVEGSAVVRVQEELVSLYACVYLRAHLVQAGISEGVRFSSTMSEVSEEDRSSRPAEKTVLTPDGKIRSVPHKHSRVGRLSCKVSISHTIVALAIRAAASEQRGQGRRCTGTFAEAARLHEGLHGGTACAKAKQGRPRNRGNWSVVLVCFVPYYLTGLSLNDAHSRAGLFADASHFAWRWTRCMPDISSLPALVLSETPNEWMESSIAQPSYQRGRQTCFPKFTGIWALATIAAW